MRLRGLPRHIGQRLFLALALVLDLDGEVERVLSEISPVLDGPRDHAANTRLTPLAHSVDNLGAMPDFFPLQLLVATFAGWVTRDQAQVIAYLVEENLERVVVGRHPIIVSVAKSSSALRLRRGRAMGHYGIIETFFTGTTATVSRQACSLPRFHKQHARGHQSTPFPSMLP